MTPKCFKNAKKALAPSTVFCDKKLKPVELRRDTWTTYICSVFSYLIKQSRNWAYKWFFASIHCCWTGSIPLCNSLHRHKESWSTGIIVIKLLDLDRFAKVLLIFIKFMPPHNSKHMLITFATNLDTMNKVKANYASSSSSRSINCAIRGTPRSYYLCWSQITTVHLWTKLFSSKHDVWILVGNTG